MKVKRESWEGLASALRGRREELGETAASIAKKCGFSRSYYSQIERGEIRNPTLETTDRVLRALGLDLILGGSREEANATTLAYESPFSSQGRTNGDDPPRAESAIELLQRTLTDQSIPLNQRKLLEHQVAALVRLVRQQIHGS